MSDQGFSDQEIRTALRARGVPESAIERWISKTHKTELVGNQTWIDAPAFCPDCASGTVCAAHSGPTTLAVSEHQPTPETRSRGKLGGKATRRDTRSEAQIQREIVKALKAAGYEVWRIGQRDARKTQDPGVPDLYAIRPWLLGDMGDVRVPCGAGRTAWIEVKTATGRQSEAQRAFQRCCEAAGVRYILARNLDDVRDLL